MKLSQYERGFRGKARHTDEMMRVAASCEPQNQLRRYSSNLRSTALTINTGSSAASNKSYLAIKATGGNNTSGTKNILLTTATKTVLFSPG